LRSRVDDFAKPVHNVSRSAVGPEALDLSTDTKNELATQQRERLAKAREKAQKVLRAKAEQSPPTLREMRFAMHWIRTLNGRESAILAGYSEKDADQRAWRLMKRPRVRAMIALMQERYARDLRIETETTLREFAHIAFANVADFIDDEGRVDLSKVGRDQMAAVSEIVTETYTEGKGEDKETVKRVKLRFHPKTAALESLAKHLGLFERDNAQKTPIINILNYANAQSVAFNPDGSKRDA
jgi:phage terminase small subunit